MVCTANRCRSPLAAALLTRELALRGVQVEVSSAGMLQAGIECPVEMCEVAGAIGIDLKGHRSRTISADAIRSSDLVLCMSREHVREVVLAAPGSFGRTFTLRELVRRGAAVGTRQQDVEVPEWLARVHQGRKAADLLGTSADDDVGDPFGGPLTGYQVLATELQGLCRQLADLLWPRIQRGDAAPMAAAE